MHDCKALMLPTPAKMTGIATIFERMVHTDPSTIWIIPEREAVIFRFLNALDFGSCPSAALNLHLWFTILKFYGFCMVPMFGSYILLSALDHG